MKQIIIAALTLLVALTGIAAAEARGGMAANGIICGTGSYAIVLAADGLPLFDGNGAPVERGDLPCFDCTFVQLGPIPGAGTLGAADMTATTLGPAEYRTQADITRIMGGKGRGPPA